MLYARSIYNFHLPIISHYWEKKKKNVNKTVNHIRKLNTHTELPYDLAIPLLGMFPKN